MSRCKGRLCSAWAFFNAFLLFQEWEKELSIFLHKATAPSSHTHTPTHPHTHTHTIGKYGVKWLCIILCTKCFNLPMARCNLCPKHCSLVQSFRDAALTTFDPLSVVMHTWRSSLKPHDSSASLSPCAISSAVCSAGKYNVFQTPTAKIPIVHYIVNGQAEVRLHGTARPQVHSSGKYFKSHSSFSTFSRSSHTILASLFL